MSVQPPPPPQQDWPTPTGPPGGGGGRQRWWTGGRVVAAIVIVLVLMAGAGFAGFLAGAAWGGFDDVLADLESELGSDFDGGFSSDMPGFTHLDTPVVEGAALRPGSSAGDVVGDRPVEHTLTLESSADVHIEVSEAEFDTVLVLLDADGSVLDTDDDGGGDTLSAIEASLSPGTYVVRVQSWSGDSGGSYTLAVD